MTWKFVGGYVVMT